KQKRETEKALEGSLEKERVRNVSDAGWREIRRQLEYRTAWAGKQLVVIDRWYPSSRKCGKCGYINPEVKDLRVRKWKCPVCGERHDRDINAARNILEEGLRQIS
ncbi:MAG: transposase, partial [Clostridia bacterium]|nr:transposase [Clostridia bacterium]